VKEASKAIVTIAVITTILLHLIFGNYKGLFKNSKNNNNKKIKNHQGNHTRTISFFTSSSSIYAECGHE
jgi:hypothetical protein